MFRAKIDFSKEVTEQEITEIRASGGISFEASSHIWVPKNVDVVNFGPQIVGKKQTLSWEVREPSQEFKDKQAKKFKPFRSKPTESDMVDVPKTRDVHISEISEEKSYIEFSSPVTGGYHNSSEGGINHFEIDVPYEALEMLDDAIHNSKSYLYNAKVDLRAAAQKKITEAFNQYKDDPQTFWSALHKQRVVGVSLDL